VPNQLVYDNAAVMTRHDTAFQKTMRFLQIKCWMIEEVHTLRQNPEEHMIAEIV